MVEPARKPRIAVTLEACWHRVPGGTARAALEICEAVRTSGEVELIGVAARHSGPPPAPWVPTVPVAFLPLPRTLLYETWHRFGFPPVEWVTGPVDAIHVTALAMPRRTVPIVVTLHDLAFLRYPEYFTSHGLRFFHAALERVRRDADLVLCSSGATRQDAIDAGLDSDRLRVVPLGVDAGRATSEAVAEVRRKFAIPGRFVLHLGTGEPRKNTAALTRIAPMLPADVSVVLAGGVGWGEPAGAGSQTGSRVISVGFVSEADKAALLAAADVFCFPSFWEGFGLPVLEAMAQGTPVVTSKATSMAEIVEDAGWLVDPGDDEEIVAALCEVLDDPSLASRLADAGRARAARYTWGHTARRTVAAFREVI